jgi:hypothetical protein
MVRARFSFTAAWRPPVIEVRVVGTLTANRRFHIDVENLAVGGSLSSHALGQRPGGQSKASADPFEMTNVR